MLAIVSVGAHHYTEQNTTNKYGFCKNESCQMVTLPRTYHFFYCRRCVLRKDHHCHWLGTCIGLLNYKFYWQFLLYTTLCFLVLAVTTIAVEGITILSLLGAVFLFDFGALFALQTKRVLKN